MSNLDYVFLGVYTTDEGVEIEAYETEELAEAAWCQIAANKWSSMMGDEPMPDDPTAAALQYFSAANDRFEGGEYYEIREVKLHHER